MFSDVTKYSCRVAVITGMLGLTPSARPTNLQDALTVRETVGIVFTSGEVSLWNFMARANPTSRPILYKVLKNPSLVRYHPNAILLLAYIGDKVDVVALENYLLGLRGQLRAEQTAAIMAVLDALGIMGRRDVEGALDTLQEMLLQDYWSKIQFQWYPRDAIMPPGGDLGELVTWALWGYAKSEREGLEQIVQATFDAFDDPKVRDYLRNRSSVDRMRMIAREIRHSETLELDRRVQASLIERWNGNADEPDISKLPNRTEAIRKVDRHDNGKRSATKARGAAGFLAAVHGSFDAWMKANKQSQDLRQQLGYGIRESQEYKDLNAQENSARRSFAVAVASNWPFETDGDTSQRLAQVTMALEESRALHQAYREGKGSRDDVLAKWLTLADRYPGTIEHDEALYWAGKLYLEHLRPGMKMDIAAARRTYERLTRRPGPPSGWTLMAESNLMSFPDDPTQRMNARSQFVKDMAARLDPQWLRTHLLVPTKDSTPERFMRQIDDYLLILADIRKTTAHNMLSDAKGTPDRFENLKQLNEEHAEDPFVEAAFSRDGTAPPSSFWSYFLRVSLACIVLAVVIGGVVLMRRQAKVPANQASAAPSRRRVHR